MLRELGEDRGNGESGHHQFALSHTGLGGHGRAHRSHGHVCDGGWQAGGSGFLHAAAMVGQWLPVVACGRLWSSAQQKKGRTVGICPPETHAVSGSPDSGQRLLVAGSIPRPYGQGQWGTPDWSLTELSVEKCGLGALRMRAGPVRTFLHRHGLPPSRHQPTLESHGRSRLNTRQRLSLSSSFLAFVLDPCPVSPVIPDCPVGLSLERVT